MTAEAADRRAPPPSRPGGVRAVSQALLRTLPGHLLLAGLAVRLLAWFLRSALGLDLLIIDAFGTIGSLAVLAALVYYIYLLIVRAKRQLLWRVRRKLILSYIFVGVVPVLLVVAFFLLAALFIFFNLSSYLVATSIDRITGDARLLAHTTVADLERSGKNSGLDVLERRRQDLVARYPNVSLAVVPVADQPCPGMQPPGGAATSGQPPQIEPVSTGPWSFSSPPRTLPTWVRCQAGGFAGLLGISREQPGASEREAGLIVRAVELSRSGQRLAVIVDIPVDESMRERIHADTSVRLDRVTLLEGAGNSGPIRGVLPKLGEAQPGSQAPLKRSVQWLTILDWHDWPTGATEKAMLSYDVNMRDIYERVSAAQASLGTSGSRAGQYNFGSLMLTLLVVLAGLFFIIEVVALTMGLVLARSITGSVHELFRGTQRVREGDFSHKIRIQTRDQMGELAESFNTMTASIEDLLHQAAEKKRLEEELRIARDIQMSLLPRGPLSVPGLSITGLCVPAREVGGDYYDLLPLEDHRLGVLVADVAGKGTSAALYMAELKGLILSLSRIHQSPRQLLIEANRIIARNISSRSFITMTYAVLDLRARTMTYARAGHTPLMYRTRDGGTEPQLHVLVPDGLVVGLQMDDGGKLFERLLQEETLHLRQGDLLIFFTDGITEAMNEESDCFGEARLAEIIAEHGDLPLEQLRERILREIEAFVAGAPQHDDMTMILAKVEAVASDAVAEAEQSAQALPVRPAVRGFSSEAAPRTAEMAAQLRRQGPWLGPRPSTALRAP